MLRYLALLWDRTCCEDDAVAAVLCQRVKNSSPKWSCVLLKPGLSLLVFESPFAHYQPHLLDNACGAVLGLLFSRRDPQRNSAQSAGFFDGKATEGIVRSGGRDLVENYWGRYIAFLDDACTNVRSVLRDPVGDIQCYHARVSGISFYFSTISDFLELGVVRPTVNWEHLGLRVITGNAWADESALNEIECVHPGESVEHNGRQISRKYYWHPFMPARAPWRDGFEAAGAELRSTIRTCTTAWASLHESSVHILSGGLDSSIVLSCLARTLSRDGVVCLNFRTRDDPDSDERSYARLATARAGCELVELDRKPVVLLEQIFACEPTAGPQHLVMRGLEVQPLIAQVASHRNATAVFSGDGGDIVFFRGWPELAVVDYAHSRGIGRGLVRLAYGAALPSQLSVWRLLGDAVKYGVLRRPWDIRELVFHHYRMVTDGVVLNARRKLNFLNPWELPVDDLPPGKLLHAFGATRPSLFRDPLTAAPTADVINPLVSQPVVELCLRIPTYLHAAEGKDRAVARTAFAGDLPREILTRVWKGAADRHLQEMLSSNLGLVRQVLLDGGLVKAGILDRKRLEKAVAPGAVGSVSHAAEVFGYFCAEAWLHRWRYVA